MLTASRLGVACGPLGGCNITIDGSLWSSSILTAVRSHGVLCSTSNGTLKLVRSSGSAGSDRMGRYEAHTNHWSCGGSPFDTTVRLYSGLGDGGEALVFAQAWPDGAAGTAIASATPGKPAPGTAQEQVISLFPSITPADSQALGQQRSFVVWGQMIGGMADGTKYANWGDATAHVPGGTMAGPLVVWGKAHALVLAPVTNGMATNLVWSGTSRTYSAGLLGSIDAIPAGVSTETLLYLGPSGAAACAPYACGVPSAVRGFGTALRRYKGKDLRFPSGGYDPTLAYLGYYSDARRSIGLRPETSSRSAARR
jgi:hypothetical protein